VRLDHKLKNGDTVEILTASRGGPSRDWMNESLGYTGSARTRSRIRRWFRLQEREKNIQQGRDVVTRELKRLGLTDVFTVEDIATALKENVVDDFLTKVGFGDIQANQVSGAIAIMRSKLRADDELLPLLTPRTKRVGLTVRGVAGLHTRMAQCCNPVPPEEITGFITRGRGVTVHRTNCHTVRMTSEPERLIDVSWGEESEVYPIPFVLQAFNRPGLMNDITNVLKGRGINLTKTKAKIVNSVATIYLVAEVTDLVELDWLLRKLEQLPNVIEVRRQRWAE
jgi:GTP pyrophosphokinase